MRIVHLSPEGHKQLDSHRSGAFSAYLVPLLVAELAANSIVFGINSIGYGDDLAKLLSIDQADWEVVSHIGVSALAFLLAVLSVSVARGLQEGSIINQHEVDLRGDPVR